LSDVAQQRPASRLALIGEANFRRLWYIGGLGEAVRWLEVVAISIYVFEATQSALIVTLVNFCRGFSLLLVSPAIGSLAGRVDRRFLLAISAAGPLATTAVVGALALTGPVAIWILAIVSAANGLAYSTEVPVRRNMVGEAAGLDRIATGMGLDGITRQATRIAGPAMGGILLREAGLDGALLFAAAVYVICTWLALRVRMSAGATKAAEQESLFTTIVEGFRYARSQPALVGTLAVSLTAQMFFFCYISLIPAIGRTTLALDPLEIGLLTSAEGLGALLGALAVALWAKPTHFRGIYLIGTAAFGCGILAFSNAPTFAVALTALFLGGLGLGGFSTMQATLPFVNAKPEMRARMMGMIGVLFGFGPFGVIHAGLMADWLGAGPAVTVVAIEGLVLLTLAALWWRRAVPT